MPDGQYPQNLKVAGINRAVLTNFFAPSPSPRGERATGADESVFGLPDHPTRRAFPAPFRRQWRFGLPQV